MLEDKWSLNKIPPKNHPEVGDFAENLFNIAQTEKERLGKNEDFLANYSLYRNKKPLGVSNKFDTPVNLFFSNIERSVASVTARQPQGEVVDLDGYNDGAEKVLSNALMKWWKNTNQQAKIKLTARTMEVYGITVEKPLWNKEKSQPEIMLTDPFSFFPAPGNWENISTDAPYSCYAYLEFVSKAEKDFNVEDIMQEDSYTLLGAEREEYKVASTQQRIGNYADAQIPADREKGQDQKIERCLIKEIWLRDTSTHTVTEENPIIDETGMQVIDEAGNPLIEQTKRKEQIYPDGIRKITIVKAKKDGVKNSYIVLDDSANPNINSALEPELASKTYPWGRLPVYTANSYKDLVSIWGFSAAEQVGDLLIKINKIVTKLVNYVLNVMAPPLIVQQHCGITRAMIEENIEKGGRLVLMPTIPNARIEFMQIPNLPVTFFQVLDLIVRFYDRIYATESADRGEAPRGVIAASAIQSLQERNQVLMQSKTDSIETIAEERSRWAIGLWQNFGINTELVEVSEQMVPFRGVAFAGRQFGFVIESGSTMPRTSLAIQEMAVELFNMRAIDRRALLEAVNFPDYENILERTAETELEQALQILIEAGLDEQQAQELYQYLLQPGQNQTKNRTASKKSTEAKTAKAGVPRAQQGQA